MLSPGDDVVIRQTYDMDSALIDQIFDRVVMDTRQTARDAPRNLALETAPPSVTTSDVCGPCGMFGSLPYPMYAMLRIVE